MSDEKRRKSKLQKVNEKLLQKNEKKNVCKTKRQDGTNLFPSVLRIDRIWPTNDWRHSSLLSDLFHCRREPHLYFPPPFFLLTTLCVYNIVFSTFPFYYHYSCVLPILLVKRDNIAWMHVVLQLYAIGIDIPCMMITSVFTLVMKNGLHVMV